MLNTVFEDFLKAAEKMTEEEKSSFNTRVEETKKYIEASVFASKMRYDRAFKKDSNCLLYGTGEHCVYMWLHADGTPFYVGRGKGDRWKNSIARNERFLEETKKLDTLVCKVIDGLSVDESCEAEFCLSHYLSYIGYNLANGDNNYQRSVNQGQADRRVGKFTRLMQKEHNKLTLEQAKLKIHPYKMPCDYNLMYEQYVNNYGVPG